jgi:hypothetical protein
MGRNIEAFDGDNLLTYGPTSITTHMPTDVMDQHLSTTNGDDNQFMVVLAKHGLFDQQNTKVATSIMFLPMANLTRTTQNPTQLSLKLNNFLQRYFTQLEPNVNFITHLTNLS